MTKAEFIEHIRATLAESTETKHIHEKSVIGHVLKAMGDVAAAILAEGGDVPLPGLGKLEVKIKKERWGRNPATGDRLFIPEKRTAAFRPGKALKSAITEN